MEDFVCVEDINVGIFPVHYKYNKKRMLLRFLLH